MKTSELSGIALDYAVAVAECDFRSPCDADRYNEHYFDNHYSWDWSLAGPIIERERIELRGDGDEGWIACDNLNPEQTGTTPLEAAMRCYVTSKLGEEVGIPEELI
jgi:hypothetical protein